LIATFASRAVDELDAGGLDGEPVTRMAVTNDARSAFPEAVGLADGVLTPVADQAMTKRVTVARLPSPKLFGAYGKDSSRGRRSENTS
jgi:hypothetical protein